MRKVKKLNALLMLSAAIVLSMSVLFAPGVPTSRAQSNSAVSSQPSATPVNPASDPDAGLRAACGEAVEELRAARKLLASQGVQIEKQGELLALEGQVSTGLKNLRTLDAEEKANLYKAVDAANREIAALKGANAVLKKNQVTLWKKFKWITVGAAAGVVGGVILANR